MMGYAGINPNIQTPQMDLLAKQGCYFSNAFVTTPISAASRASILTGLYERTCGYNFGTGNLKEPYRALLYPTYLKNNGYYTGCFGKLGVRIPESKTLFDECDYYLFSGYRDKRCYFYKTINGDTVHLTTFTGHQAVEFIENAPEDKPFILNVGFAAPHAADQAPDQYFWSEANNEIYEDMTMPDPILNDEKYFNRLPKEVRVGESWIRWKWRYDTPEKYQHSIKGYFRMIKDIDDEIAKIRTALEKKGVADNTVIIFMGDNGYFLGERKIAGKWLMYDNSLRVPMAIYDPRADRHRDIDDMVLNIDITQTILDLAQIPAPKEYQGVSLVPYLEGGKPKVKRDAILFEHLLNNPRIPQSEGLRTERWKYMRYRQVEAPEELYDLQKDPLETENLAGQKKYEKVLLKMRQECDRQIKKYTDAQLTPKN